MSKLEYTLVIIILFFICLFAGGAVFINGVKIEPGIKIGRTVNHCLDVSGDGYVVLRGDARVRRSVSVPSESFEAPLVNPATLNRSSGITTAWEFSDATEDTVGGKILVPDDVDTTERPVLKIWWVTTVVDPGDNSKKAYWQLDYSCRRLDENVDGSADNTLFIESIASTTRLAVSEAVYFVNDFSEGDRLIVMRVKRRADLTNDTINSDDVYLLGMRFVYCSDKLGAVW